MYSPIWQNMFINNANPFDNYMSFGEVYGGNYRSTNSYPLFGNLSFLNYNTSNNGSWYRNNTFDYWGSNSFLKTNQPYGFSPNVNYYGGSNNFLNYNQPYFSYSVDYNTAFRSQSVVDTSNTRFCFGAYGNYPVKSTVTNNNSSNIQQVKSSQQVTQKKSESVAGNTSTQKLYNSLGLENEGLSYEVFALAMEGYQKLKNKGNGYLGIVDPKTKRYYLIDLNNSKFIEKSDVKFGSGDMGAVANANKNGSHATLSGFTQVKEEYASTKSHWSSRAKRLDGLETGINNNARSKSVVIHSTQYNTTWGCIGFTPVMKNGKQDDAATNAKLRRLFPKDTIIFTYPTDVNEYKSLSALC